MIQRASLFLSLVLLSASACTSSAPVESRAVERLERYPTKWELRAKEVRHQMREQARAEGKWVCEEGDWPQEWWDGCWRCSCGVGEVGECTMDYCPPSEWRRRQQQHPGPLPEPLPNLESVESVDNPVGKRLEKLGRRTMGDVHAKAWRHREREELRAAGARVCEEGDWPQEWKDGCGWCWCNAGQVRQCDHGPECDEVERSARLSN
jgi:hypothetical protein